jgi:hypothetical protein
MNSTTSHLWRASTLQNPSSRFPENPKQMTPRERIPEVSPVWQARKVKYFKMMCRLTIPALSTPNFAWGNIALALRTGLPSGSSVQ